MIELRDHEALSVDAKDTYMTRRRYAAAAQILRRLARHLDQTPVAELPGNVASFFAWLEDSLDAQEPL